jgi:glycosyltransferase involved in cell wall biosynthesis
VVDRENGLVCDPVPAAVAAACSWLAANPDEARACGRSGKKTAERVTWDNVLDRLVAS